MRLQGFRYRIIRLYDDFADLLVAMKGDCLSLNKHCKFLTITMAHAIGEGTGSQIVKALQMDAAKPFSIRQDAGGSCQP